MKAKIPGAQAVASGATPEDYRVVFEMSPIGNAVLEDLVARFSGKVYVPGGLEGERETCFRSGKREVVEHILRMINRANGAPSTEEGD
jgi:hypothetical protein